MGLQNSKKLRKYKIEELMDNLPWHEHAEVKKLIPKLIGKCVNTFNNYARIPFDAKEEIPNNIVVILEDLFGVGPRGLNNVKIKCKHYKELIRSTKPNQY